MYVSLFKIKVDAVGPMVPLFPNSHDSALGFQSQGGFTIGQGGFTIGYDCLHSFVACA